MTSPADPLTQSGRNDAGPCRPPALRLRLRKALPGFVAAAVLGAAFALSFAPWGNGWASLAVLALYAGLIAHGVLGTGRPAPAWRGFGFGLGWFCVGIGWLYISMHDFGELPAPLAALAVLLLAAYLSIYFVGATWLAARTLARRGPLAFAIVFGAATVLAEWLRGTVFTGLPWVAVGYAQVDAPLAGYAPLVGAYGVGGIAALLAALLAIVGVTALGRNGGRRRRWQPAALALVAAVLLAGQGLRTVDWSTPIGRPLDVRLIQGNVAQQMKFDPAQALAAMAAYTEAIEAEATTRPDLILLPETAWIVPWQRTPPELAERVLAAVRTSGSTVALGLPLVTWPARRDSAGMGASVGTGAGAHTDADRAPPVARTTNSIVAISPDPGAPDGVTMAQYDKRHLVPFGEFIPPGFRWFVDMMKIPLGDFDRGLPGQTPFGIGGQRVAGLVCYEDAFGDEVAAAVRGDAGATLLANVTNVGWFGHSHASDQHLQMARMRTLELARPMVRATNTGMTAAIDADGTVLAMAEPFVRTAIAARVQGRTGLTPYARAGDWPALALAVAALALAGPWRRPGRPAS